MRLAPVFQSGTWGLMNNEYEKWSLLRKRSWLINIESVVRNERATAIQCRTDDIHWYLSVLSHELFCRRFSFHLCLRFRRLRGVQVCARAPR